eukprot:TRINITY_DN27878_c0_g1_i1.p1 TRINITY_DN27878_c0_g1~~TRINITY_DN27878_c0_g1_i1.p1  ORF type:complete len:367 (-),score=45.35 TRINITY_DN27878_c0_g1_i1:116-1216(-)
MGKARMAKEKVTRGKKGNIKKTAKVHLKKTNAAEDAVEVAVDYRPLAMAYRAVGYPHLSMCLELGRVYTVAELETRCGSKDPKRRARLYQKLQDPSCFRPTTLDSAFDSPKKRKKKGVRTPLWARPPVLDDPKVVERKRRIANNVARALLQKNQEISDKHVVMVLKSWGFGRNTARQNVMPLGAEWVNSDTLGMNRSRDGRVKVTGASRRHKYVTNLLVRWFKDGSRANGLADFKCTSIAVNCDYAAARHRDGNNAGPSVVKAFGKFTGGELCYWPKDNRKQKDVKKLKRADCIVRNVEKSPFLFDGRKAHEVRPFKGKRFSLVFFTCGGYSVASTAEKELLVDTLGFPAPTGPAPVKGANFENID